MEAIDYTKLANELAAHLQQQVPFEAVLWSADECANYLRVSRRTLLDRVSKNHTFPMQVSLPNGMGGELRPNWYASEVIEWTKQYGRKKRT